MVLPRGNVYFAGKHLSVYRRWILSILLWLLLSNCLAQDIDLSANVSLLERRLKCIFHSCSCSLVNPLTTNVDYSCH